MESKVSEGGLNVTLTIRLLMHGKVQGRDRGGEGRHAHRTPTGEGRYGGGTGAGRHAHRGGLGFI